MIVRRLQAFDRLGEVSDRGIQVPTMSSGDSSVDQHTAEVRRFPCAANEHQRSLRVVACRGEVTLLFGEHGGDLERQRPLPSGASGSEEPVEGRPALGEHAADLPIPAQRPADRQPAVDRVRPARGVHRGAEVPVVPVDRLRRARLIGSDEPRPQTLGFGGEVIEVT
ncbi:MAG: hypothetical protein U0470_02725 [Anaerolineae bacterium]